MAFMIRHPPLIPPPLYERDPETSSIISAAPSYVSDRPPNYSHREPEATTTNAISSGPPSAAESAATLVDDSPAPQLSHIVSEPVQPVQQGLPPLRYAPGFSARGRNVRDVEAHSYNISHWSSVHTSHAAKQYQNVAARRTSQASSAALLSSMSPISPSISASSIASTASMSSTNLSSPMTASSSSIASESSLPPLSPREDPALVGELAASRARAQRLYRETCMRGEEGRRHENKTWDFMLGQMADWEERGRSWSKFRSEVAGGKTRLGGKILGRKIALSGLRERV
ncbi:hypothetical protein NA57DRAFT_76159 [Rhizodiscina lignyota]|uniref:Uncharacterized protein n=1 Tax=Rhizodiscina lignyota TaxID=1504668 RepID=A0A9P4IGM4_9PEZI|nr:hypothetical protein NA57DRAFT_76159 [Rhizodiscina lignyota]